MNDPNTVIPPPPPEVPPEVSLEAPPRVTDPERASRVAEEDLAAPLLPLGGDPGPTLSLPDTDSHQILADQLDRLIQDTVDLALRTRHHPRADPRTDPRTAPRPRPQEGAADTPTTPGSTGTTSGGASGGASGETSGGGGLDATIDRMIDAARGQ